MEIIKNIVNNTTLLIKKKCNFVVIIYLLCLINNVLAKETLFVETVKPRVNQSQSDIEKVEKTRGLTQIRVNVSIKGINDQMLLDNINAYLDIYKYKDKPLESESYASFLIELGKKQIKNALKPYGYYLAEVDVLVNKENSNWEIDYQINKGAPVKVNTTLVTLSGEGLLNNNLLTVFEDFSIHEGENLVQPEYEKYKTALQKTALQEGFFEGNFDKKQIVISEDLKTANIDLDYRSGERFNFGQIVIEQDFLDDDVFDRFKNFHQEESYHVSAIADLQKNIYNSGYVRVIDVDAKPDKKTKQVPVKLKLVPNKNKVHTFKIGYGTDSGARANYDFDWRWINRRGHKLKYDVFVSQTHSDMGIVYQIPGKHAATDSYNIIANLSQDERNSRRSTTVSLAGEYKDKRNDLERAFGVELLRENFRVGEISGSSSLVIPYAKFKYKKTDNDLAINKGFIAEGSLVGSYEAFLSDISFAQAKLKLGYLNKLTPKHKVKLFGSLGRTWVSDFDELPVSYRFFTGGDNTVRGYAFERIGEANNEGNVIGGDTLLEMSAEYEYFFKENMAVAAFVDAGDAYSSGNPSLKVGAGLGFHYYLPIGPIRVDLAHGFDEAGDNFRLHLNIGPEF